MRRGAALVIALAACHSAQSAATQRPAEATVGDTLRGTLVLEGSDPMPLVVLRTATGRVMLDAVPDNMRKLSQLDLWIRGTAMPGARFRVSEFLVRAADGQPAWDGTVVADGTGFALKLPDGSPHALRSVPPDFGKLLGKRIWVTETAAHTLAAYGVI